MSDRKDQDNHLDEGRIERILRGAGRRPRPPEDMTRETRAAVKQVWRAEVDKSRGISPAAGRWLAIAATIALLVVTGIFYQTEESLATVARTVNRVELKSGDQWLPLSEQVSLPGGRLRTASDAYALINLASGAQLRLAGNTMVTLQQHDHVILEHGAIYMDSRSGEDNLVVSTPFGMARDIGTQFLVTVADNGWHVQVREGEVQVTDDDVSVNAYSGDRVLISADNRVAKESVEPHDASWSWIHNVSPAITIEGMRVIDYLNWYSRETGIKIKFGNEATRRTAESTILSGSISGLEPADALTAVLSSAELQQQRDGQAILINQRQ